MTKPDTVSQYFNTKWTQYQQALKNNTLWHREMMENSSSFIDKNMGSRPFSFVDVGCGDGSMIIAVLAGKAIKKYIGIDAASEVLKLAEKNLEVLQGDKEFICGNMVDAIDQLNTPVDIIYSSYAVHHLSLQEKVEFINKCQKHLNDGGYLIMIDSVLKENQTREQWLDVLEDRIKSTQKPSLEELKSRMEHPRADDFPEAISTFMKIALEQKWEKFEVPVETDISAMMIFHKADSGIP